MTDFTPGAIITRDSPLWDGDRPSWLRDDVRIMIRTEKGGYWYGKYASISMFADGITDADDAIRLDASDIVYRCLEWNEAHPDEAPWFPWYGGREAPADWDEGDVLDRSGRVTSVSGRKDCDWQNENNPLDVIGYRKRRPTTSLPEPAEEEARRESARIGAWVHRRMKEAATRGLAHTSGYAETIEESPEDFARAACERAGGVFVSNEQALYEHEIRFMVSGPQGAERTITYLTAVGLVLSARSPLELAKAAHPNISPEIVESIFKMGEGAE